MWIAPYHRDALINNENHASFGEKVETLTLTDELQWDKLPRQYIRLPDHFCKGATCFDRDGKAPPSHKTLLPCEATFRYSITEPTVAVAFLPDHAILTGKGDNARIISESLWHSELFFSKYVRNDRSTEWQWRVDPAWTETHVVSEEINYCYHRYQYQYFHWLMDSLWRVWLVHRCLPSSRKNRWFIGPLAQHFQIPSLALFDISPDDCHWINGNAIVRFEHAIFQTATFEEPLKTLRPSYDFGTYHVGWSPAYFEELHDRAVAKYAPSTRVSSNEKLYITRQHATHRRIVNENEVIARLEPRGFRVVDPAAYPFAEQVSLFASARAIASVHGAGLTNALWARRGCRMLEFAPEGLNDIGYRFLADLAGHDYAVIVCPTLEHRLGLPYADLRVDIEALDRALEEFF
ncbi:MAG: glycosyltransferase family 61 protein [Alphaproteobacteria bacterium]|nr:glycosyltransferase family 61 protein [Alphaproteobacteria bacterium]